MLRIFPLNCMVQTLHRYQKKFPQHLQLSQPKGPMATARLLRSSNKPLGRVFAPSSWLSSSAKTVRYTSKGGVKGEKKICGNCEKKPTVAAKALATTLEAAERSIARGRELANVVNAMREVLLRPVLKRPWKLHIQMFIENVILNCRFFTIFAVAGSLFGSILCFMEYFRTLFSKKLDQEHIIHLLIEAIDMFLVGTAMLIFGMGLYIMFVGSKTMKGGAPSLPRSNLFGLFHWKTLPAWVEMESISQAKSKMGHAVMMMLQVGVLDKFKSIPIVTSLDLACFAASVFVSSACIFLLSRLSVGTGMEDR